MIFATVGTQLPFDRMLKALDEWSRAHREVPVFAQTGDGAQRFEGLETVDRLGLAEFEERFSRAKLIVAHAGMGTILSAAEMGKPIILMPRRAAFNEHRNDHQVDTAREMARLSNVTVVEDAVGLRSALDEAYARDFREAAGETEEAAEMLAPLIDEIRSFVWAEQHASERGVVLTEKVA